MAKNRFTLKHQSEIKKTQIKSQFIVFEMKIRLRNGFRKWVRKEDCTGDRESEKKMERNLNPREKKKTCGFYMLRREEKVEVRNVWLVECYRLR